VEGEPLNCKGGTRKGSGTSFEGVDTTLLDSRRFSEGLSVADADGDGS